MVFMKQLIQSFNSTVVSGTVVQSVTETELQKIQSMKKHLTRSIPKLSDEHDNLKMPVIMIEKWSCEFSDEDRRRAHEFGLESKVPQLVPNNAFYGGRTEAINLRKTLSEDDIQNGKEILYYDMTSEYPFVNSRKEYPVGDPKIFLKHQVPQTNEEWHCALLFLLQNCYILSYHLDIKEHLCFLCAVSVVWKNTKKIFVGTQRKSELSLERGQPLKLTRRSCWVTNYWK